jgi:hypothetical protein
VAAYGLLEIAALIDKGRPLLFSNLIRIIAMNPPEIIAVSVGLVAGLLWLFVCLKLSMLGFSLACALRRRFTLKGESAN